MNACCETPTFEPPTGPARPPGRCARWCLIGPPNSGKSTLFNRLTGLRQKVANFPGVTVEQRMGLMAGVGRDDLTLIDLPGIYSLDPYSRTPASPSTCCAARCPARPSRTRCCWCWIPCT
jgi:ferrous iron transport protein B